MTTCRACGGEVPRRSRLYCSNTCQQDLQRKQRVELWLASGRCVADTHQGHDVREYLYAEQKGACAVCGLPASGAGLRSRSGWTTSTATRRDNLRLVCASCDSQLPTYQARNKGRGRAWRRTLLEGPPSPD